MLVPWLLAYKQLAFLVSRYNKSNYTKLQVKLIQLTKQKIHLIYLTEEIEAHCENFYWRKKLFLPLTLP